MLGGGVHGVRVCMHGRGGLYNARVRAHIHASTPGSTESFNEVDACGGDFPFFLRADEGRQAVARETAVVPCDALEREKRNTGKH